VKKRLIIGVSGSSGVIYGVRLLEVLKEQGDIETHLVMSDTAKLNLSIETDYRLADVVALADEVHELKNVAASISSGSFGTMGMIVAPCSMKTLSGIVHSYSDNLLLRAADVVLKERRRLALVVRETPLHTGHCKLLYEASLLNAVIVPPVPAFYSRPRTIDDIVNHTVGRLLDLYGIESGRLQRWTGVKKPVRR
jgi:4-hydroxy-3-polyprenylbenzoate decarboxylase